MVLFGLKGDREQLASIWCSPLARAPAPWAFRSPGKIIPFPLTFGLGPVLPGFHHGQCASKATPGVPGPPVSWLGQARLAGRSGAGVSDPSPLLTKEGGEGSHASEKGADAGPGSPTAKVSLYSVSAEKAPEPRGGLGGALSVCSQPPSLPTSH